jgi:5-formyltetrahydrofolate cyclo-ligase
MSGPTLREEKTALRRRMRDVRAGLRPEERRRRADLIEHRLFQVPAFSEATRLLLFASFGTEVPTEGIVRRLIETGQQVLLPYLEHSVMHAAELTPEHGLGRSTYGPDEPLNRVPADPSSVDLVVAPGLAFDRRGFRLGYGDARMDLVVTDRETITCLPPGSR